MTMIEAKLCIIQRSPSEIQRSPSESQIDGSILNIKSIPPYKRARAVFVLGNHRTLDSSPYYPLHLERIYDVGSIGQDCWGQKFIIHLVYRTG